MDKTVCKAASGMGNLVYIQCNPIDSILISEICQYLEKLVCFAENFPYDLQTDRFNQQFFSNF